MNNLNKKPSVKLNFLYNIGYQIFTMIVPLITTPYISKVLLAEGVGRYSYTYSIANYFVLFAQLGFDYYAQREIAKVQGKKYEQSIIFFEIMLVKFLTVGISSTVYITMCLTGVFGDYTLLMWCWLILILAQQFDIAFIFKGNEEFSKIVFRNLFIKLAGIVAIFMFVKTKEDTWIYVLCFSVSNFLGVFTTWAYLSKYLRKVKISELKPLKHFWPAVRLFVPTIASMVYAYLDKTLIGVLIKDTYTEVQNVVVDGVTQTTEIVKKYSDLENGFYEQSEKIVKIGMSVITALGAVMLPRNTKENATGNSLKLKENIYTASRFVMLIGIPIMFGLIGLADNLVPWFLGAGFSKSITYLRLFCPLVLLIGFDNVFGMQYLMATNRDKQYTIAVLSGTLINAIFNVVLIPFFWGYGAIAASLLSQAVVVTIMYVYIRKEISLWRIISSSVKYLIAGCIMLLGMIVTQSYMQSSIVNTLILISEAVIIYGVMLLVLRDKFIIENITKIFNKIFKKKAI